MNPEDLARRLKLTRPLVFLDIESTTLNDGDEADPRVDRAVSLAVMKIYPDAKVTQFGTYINPGMKIQPSSTEIHGITDDQVQAAPAFSKIGRAVAAGLHDCDLCGYYARRYDVRLFVAECTRHGVPYDAKGAHVIDPYLLWAAMEPRDLAAWLKRFTGTTHASHQAPDDVAAVVFGLPAFLDAFPELPTTVAELGALCARKENPNYIDPEGKFQWRDGVATCCFSKEWDGTPMAQVAEGFYAYILRKNFSPEVQMLARNALKGMYPTRNGMLPLTDDPKEVSGGLEY